MESKLIKSGDEILRLLYDEDGRAFFINCNSVKMPTPLEMDIRNYEPYDESSLLNIFGILNYESLSKCERAVAHQRFSMIAEIVPVAFNKAERTRRIRECATRNGVSKQTVRKYLQRYLVFNCVSALADKRSAAEKDLTEEQKIFRWALNKFYYCKRKNSLNQAYIMMLKERYCDDEGMLLEDHPSFYKFRYYYRTHRKLQTEYISREGMKCYQKNLRPLLGEGIQEYANHVGIAMLDATICDIYLINESGNVVGRPILTAAVDAYSSMCLGYALTWEGGVYSLNQLMVNLLSDKKEWCKSRGISIKKEEWNIKELPGIFVTDKGREYISKTFNQIAEVGVTIVDLPAYRPELKGSVEKFFDLIQGMYKPHLKGKGVIEEDFRQRGAVDYRKEACLTIEQFEQILLRCIIAYNCKRKVSSFPYTEEIIKELDNPFASSIFNIAREKPESNLIDVDINYVLKVILPRTTGEYTRYGLKVNGVRYHAEGYTENYLRGGSVTVAYNPDNMSRVWVIENGTFIEFMIIESRFRNMSMDEIGDLNRKKNELFLHSNEEVLQAKVELARHIDAISSRKHSNNARIKGINEARKRERKKKHVDLLGGDIDADE